MKPIQCGMSLMAILALVSCGSTSVNRSHPLVARPDDPESGRVYFLRPDEGFSGVRMNAAAVKVGGEELLTLRPGEYCLVHLKPYDGEVFVTSWGVVGGAMTRQTEGGILEVVAGGVHHVYLYPIPTGYVPAQVTESEAREASAHLKAIGAAAIEPIGFVDP